MIASPPAHPPLENSRGRGGENLTRLGGPLPVPAAPLPSNPQPCLPASQGVSGLQAPVSLLNKDRGGVGRGLKPFAIREQPQPKITLEERAENCYLLPALKLEAGRCECVCVCTHTPPLPFVAGNHILSGPSIQQDPPSHPHFSPGSLKAAHFSGRKLFFFFACLLWWSQQQQHRCVDAYFLILLALSPSLAQLLLRNRLSHTVRVHTAELLPGFIAFTRRRVKPFVRSYQE